MKKMGRKRKVPISNEEKENDEVLNTSFQLNNGPIYTIMSKIQLNETFHKKYIKELKHIYEGVK